jgi:hypothetical protein
MKIRYDPEADVLLLVLRNNPPVDAIEEPGGGDHQLWRGWRASQRRVSERICARVDFARRDQRDHPSREILVFWRPWEWSLSARHA